MRSLLVAVFLVISAAPSWAAGCYYSDEAGARVSFENDGENTVTLISAKGAETSCTWAATPDQSSYFSVKCGADPEMPFFFGASKPGKNPRDILAFKNELWYSSCADNAL